MVCDTRPTTIRLSLSVHRIVQLNDYTKLFRAVMWQDGKKLRYFF